MYLKRLLAFLCCFAFVFCLFPSSAFATGGNGNIDGGGGSMGHGTSSNFWNSGNDGVRITVVDASSGTAVSSPLDFSNRTQKTSLLHFGKVNKLQYLGGAGLSLQSSVAYSCIRPAQSMPTIVSSKGQSNIEAIKRYFCSEYACMMVAQAAGVDYERMIAGEYKLLIEPIAYFTHNGQYYCMTATEAGLYDQMSGGNLRKTMTSLTHKNLPLSMFLEFSDLGISAWTGSTTGKQNNSDIISTLGVGIVWFDEAPPEGEIQAPDVEYRVDTDVITAVTLRTDQDLTPDNPASVTFHILGTTYRVNDIVIPAGDSQVVWVKWHTPSTPQTVTITVSVSGAYTAQDTFVAKIVDLNEHIPPDPVATDTNPGYSVPPLPSETQKLTANWGVWSCYWVPVWVWCDHGEDGGHWVDEGYWEYEYTGYSASISGEMSLMPDDIVPTASGKTMKSGYGVKTEVRATLSTDAPTSHITYPQTAFSVFPEFQYQTYLRLLQRSGGQSAKFIFKPNEFSTYDRTVHFTPLWFPDATDYTIYTQVWDTWTPDGMLSINLNDYVSIQGSLYDDWYAAAKLVDFVILDCSTSMTNVFTPAAIEAGDVVIRILTPDLKGINYLKAHQPLLVDERFRFSDHMTFAGLARPFHALDEMGYIIGGFDGLLPYSKEIDRCATEGGMFKAITYCNPKYTASLNKVLEILEQMELAEQSEDDAAYECEEDADE